MTRRPLPTNPALIVTALFLVWLLPLGCQQSATTPDPPSSASRPADVEKEAKPAKTDVSKSRSEDSPTITDRRIQFRDFSFKLPSDWKSGQPDRGTTRVLLLKGADDANKAKGLIRVDAGPAVGEEPEELARHLAKEFQGQVSTDLFECDGLPAIRVTTDSRDMRAPREVIVVYREGTAYLIMGVAVQGTNVAGPIIDILASWRWNS